MLKFILCTVYVHRGKIVPTLNVRRLGQPQQLVQAYLTACRSFSILLHVFLCIISQTVELKQQVSRDDRKVTELAASRHTRTRINTCTSLVNCKSHDARTAIAQLPKCAAALQSTSATNQRRKLELRQYSLAVTFRHRKL